MPICADGRSRLDSTSLTARRQRTATGTITGDDTGPHGPTPTTPMGDRNARERVASRVSRALRLAPASVKLYLHVETVYSVSNSERALISHHCS
eukprot:3373974-Prymnesium_polylepis.1